MRKKNSKKGYNNNDVLRLIKTPDYPGQEVRNFLLPTLSTLVSTGIGSNFAIALAIGNATTSISDWTDISNMYDQYVITGVTIEIMCLTPPTPGMAFWFFDASGNSALPNIIDESRNGVLRTNHSMNANRVWTMKYHVSNYTLLAYRNTTVDYVLGYFKGFTNLGNFGTSAISTLLYRYTVKYNVVCRGRKL